MNSNAKLSYAIAVILGTNAPLIARAAAEADARAMPDPGVPNYLLKVDFQVEFSKIDNVETVDLHHVLGRDLEIKNVRVFCNTPRIGRLGDDRQPELNMPPERYLCWGFPILFRQLMKPGMFQ